MDPSPVLLIVLSLLIYFNHEQGLVTNLVCSRAKKCVNDKEKRKNGDDRYNFCFLYFHLYPVATGSA